MGQLALIGLGSNLGDRDRPPRSRQGCPGGHSRSDRRGRQFLSRDKPRRWSISSRLLPERRGEAPDHARSSHPANLSPGHRDRRRPHSQRSLGRANARPRPTSLRRPGDSESDLVRPSSQDGASSVCARSPGRSRARCDRSRHGTDDHRIAAKPGSTTELRGDRGQALNRRI